MSDKFLDEMESRIRALFIELPDHRDRAVLLEHVVEAAQVYAKEYVKTTFKRLQFSAHGAGVVLSLEEGPDWLTKRLKRVWENKDEY